MNEAARACFAEIITQAKRPLFVAVTGDSGSGKSYLASLLAALFEQAGMGVTVINHDEFLIARAEREPMKAAHYTQGKYTGKTRWEILENMFRLDEYARVIGELRAGRAASFYPYLRETGTVTDVKAVVEPADFAVFDTSMLVGQMDFVVLVDVTQENIIARKLVRDKDVRTPEQIVEMHQLVQGYYWQDRGKPASPNLVVDNNDFAHVTVFRPPPAV